MNFDIEMIEKRVDRHERHFEKSVVWKFENRERVNRVSNEWYKRNKSRVNEYSRNRYKVDPIFRLNRSLSTGICNSLKGFKGGRSWEKLVGYTLNDLVVHLESQFYKDSNINWDNYGSYWHVDHIRPISSYNYKTAEDPEFKECWSLNNLQPLEASANLRKSDKYQV